MAMASCLDQILTELQRARGIDLSGYRRSSLERRCAARMEQLQCGESVEYLQRLRSDPSECDHLIDAIAINVSSFFRDVMVWELIAQSVLPRIIERKRQAGSREIRAWSAGCACGEEAHSLAILIHRVLGDDMKDWIPHVVATDIDGTALKAGRSGVYPRDRLESTQLGVLDRYFIARGDRYEVKPCVREMVRFSRDDLTSSERFAPVDSVFGSFDLVLCRNVIIYFSDALQARVIEKLSRSLAVGGYLILGSSESPEGTVKPKFKTIDSRNRIYQRRA